MRMQLYSETHTETHNVIPPTNVHLLLCICTYISVESNLLEKLLHYSPVWEEYVPR